MSIYKELSADQEIRVVTGIQFTIMSPDEIKRRSVAEIETSESFKGTEPKLNGLFDPRMGVIENGQICKTCEQKTTFCPGHFGHIQLAKPVFYHQFYDTIRKILKCVCFRCSALLKEPEELLEKRVVTKKATRQKRFESIYKALTKQTSTKTCNRCGSKQPDIKREPGGHFTLTWSNDDAGAGAGAEEETTATAAAAATASADGTAPEETTNSQIYYAEDVLPILQRISEVDAEFMGFSNTLNRPEWMICTVFPVPPPTVRPSVRTDTGQRAEDDLTHKLCDIVKTNNTIKLKIEKGVTAKELQPYIDTLQLHVFHFVDNKIPGVLPAKHRTGRPFRVLRERLKGKEGRIRGNLMGKRVDFSARSVITPDPNISIDELGVPTKIAMNITVPETVNETNKARMLELVRAGPTAYPGAKYLHKARENRKIILKSVDRSTIELEEGDVLDRHLANGDYVLFNRQPSLHKMSMMGHRVRVMPYDTFRVNVCVTKPYNADFDGDEMNAFIPQSIQTENELIMLASVPTQIISPGKSSPIIAVVQDVALGIYRITKPTVRITEKQMMNLIMTNSRFKGLPPAALPGDGVMQRWSGRQLLSMAIPTNINVFRENDKGENVEITEGQIVSGTLSANDYQAATSGLVHTVFNENGPEATRELFDNTQRLICDWLVQSGFSVGISDLIMDTATNEKIQQIIHKAKVDSYALIHKIHMKTFTNDTINNNEVKFEEDISEILSKANSEISSMATKYFSDDSRMINMIRSGSKGKDINVSQMTAFLAQQSIEGKRIEYGFTDRTLPHYNRYDDGPESRGFVENSFLKGLTPQEFFYHSMAGREGLIDTAVRTSTTGYIQRKLIKAMEDCKIHHDLTVRNAGGCIIQYLYGEDGMNATKLEKQSLPYADSSKTLPDIEKMYLISLKDELKYSVTDAVYDEFYQTADWGDRCKAHYKQVLEDRNYMINDVFRRSGLKNSVNFPVCFPRIIRNTKTLFKTHIARVPSDLNPLDVIDRLNEMESDMRLVKHAYGTPIRLFGILLRAYLSPKRLIMEYGFGKLAFENMIVTIKQRFYGGIAHPSEMVGVVSAQSIGEPATQLVLNTFHSSGQAQATKTVRGVPRLNELLSVSKSIKTPSMTVYLNHPESASSEKVDVVGTMIQTTYIQDIIKSSAIYYSPSDINTDIEDDKKFIEMYRIFDDITPEMDANMSPWLLRLEFDKEKMNNLHVTMADIHLTLIRRHDDKTIHCMFSDDNADKLIFRIKPKSGSDDVLTDLKVLESSILEKLIIKGIEGVRKVEKRPAADHLTYNPDTQQYEKQFEYFLITDGSNLRDVLCIPEVDKIRTITNDVHEVYKVLGIEAARQVLLDELVACLSEVCPEYRHISLLVDVMTNKGALFSIDRHGINRSDIGPLAKCSFEETSEMLIKAGMFAEYDPINGVSANIMLGQIPPCGTGDTLIIIDEAKLLEIEPPAAATASAQELSWADEMDICDAGNLEFNFRMPTAAPTASSKSADIVLNVL